MNKWVIFLLIIAPFFSCKKESVIFNGNPDENFELPLILMLDNKDCSFNAKENTLKYSISPQYLIDYTALVQFQSYSKAYFEGSELKNNAIFKFGNLQLHKPYKISIKTNGESNEFTLIFTNIPLVQIITHDPIINGDKTLSRLILHYPEKNRLSIDTYTMIEHRGSSSLNYDKKSFSFTIVSKDNFNVNISQSYFDLNPNYKWILNAMVIDFSRLRNKISFDLWNSISNDIDHIGIQSNFVEVYINNKSEGLFSFMESYTEKFLSTTNNSLLYEGIDNSSSTKFYTMPENNPATAIWEQWEQKIPNPSQIIVWDVFKDFSHLVTSATDNEFKNKIGQFINMDNAIDYYLFVNICNASDNVGKNCFYFKRDINSEFNLAPWDLDGTWGRSHGGRSVNHTGIISNGLFDRLNQTNPDNYNQRLADRWRELRRSEYSDDKLVDLISTNFEKLNSFNIIETENQLWGQDLDLNFEEIFIESWILNRVQYLDTYIN
ncbi:MAG: CotH kinase family protein [Flavobacteriales bacterium]|nr:CotH kinase family protein [Flavobacteriales bacterium]